MIQFLREKARQFRRLGKAYDTPLSPRMLEVARDLEAQADAIEGRASADRDEQPKQGT
jgi:hypothetical protein